MGYGESSPHGEDADDEEEQLDGGHGWLLVVVCWAMHVFFLGLQYSFATLFPFLLDAFGSSRGDTALILGVQVGVVTSFGLFVGPIIKRLGLLQAAVTGTLGQVRRSFTTIVCFIPWWKCNVGPSS